MPQQQEENRDCVFVRSKRTKHIDIRRANQLSPRRGALSKRQEHALHYIDSKQEHICRCNNPMRHGEKVFSVASESIHLNASLALYMTRHNVESCTAKEFQTYSRGRETEWAKEGVFVNNFHYGSREKNVVCRCTQPDHHDFNVPRNPEIIEQCAEYFCSHKNRMSVSKREWRRVDGDTPPPYGPGVLGESENSKGPKNAPSHDSGSERSAKPVSKREMKMRSNAALLTPPFVTYNSGAARQQEPEMPLQVWQNARPSLWTHREGMSSTLTTPLGSPSSPSGPSRVPATGPLPKHIHDATMPRPDSGSTCWSRVQRDANLDDMRWGMKTAPTGQYSRPESDPFRYSRYLNTNVPCDGDLGENPDASIAATETDEYAGRCPSVDERPLPPPSLDGFRLQPVAYNPYAHKYGHEEIVQEMMTSDAPVAELPAQAFTAELPVDTPQWQHTPTLERLEGRNRGTILGKEAEVKTTDHPETISNRMSSLTQNSDLFNLLLAQIKSSPVSSITDRETLPNTSNSINRVAEPVKDYLHYQKLSIAPTGKQALADRINAQREAIFDSQMTPLEDEFRIEFPQQSDIVVCTSQEDVSVAQLLLINDHVATHVIEAVHLFETQGIEPDWHADVIQPAIMLFRGWNHSFSDLISYMHEAHLNLMAWAELLRLMKTTQMTIGDAQGGDMMLCWMAELQEEFIEAEERYDKGKEKWRVDIFEPLSCDKVALYVVERAAETRTL